jgi:hypothetical protein
MKKLLILTTIFSVSLTLFAQDSRITDSIIAEGKMLYRCEMASWFGTDIFVQRFADQRSNAGGYFSYVENDLAKCIFFSKDETPKVLVAITFDSTYNIKTAQVDNKPRNFSPAENDLYIIRKLALKDLDTDTLYKVYKNTNLNLIPIINNGQKKVYVLTGPSVSGVVVIGNDYLITFDTNNQLLSRRQLHKNIIPINYNTKEGEQVFGSMHSHLEETGDYITATDICTLMLYSKYAKWEQHMVLSPNYMNIWNCRKNELLVLTKEAWQKIEKDGKESKKKQ